jgi:hypothetical protein
MKRENSEWSDLSEEVTVDEQMERLNFAINKRCSCGGCDFDDEDRHSCDWCKLWHYMCHRNDTFLGIDEKD